MASIWQMSRGRPDRKVMGHLKPEAAVQAFDALKEGLGKERRSKGWNLRDVGPHEFLVVRPDGSVEGGVFIEFASPPSKPGKGDFHVQRKEA